MISAADGLAPKAVSTEPALLRPDAASALLGCSRSALYRLVRQGRLAAVKPFGGGELRFRVEDLAAFVASLEPVRQPDGGPPNLASAPVRSDGSTHPDRP
jgi:excisionase family DNA binding protein